MKYQIEEERNEEFKPVKVSIVCETLEELQEFEIRMNLYKSDLLLVKEVSKKLPEGNSCMKGICEFRKMLNRELGKNSLLY